MLNKAGELGCNSGDVACLCRNVNFGNGIRDCSIQFCGNVGQANQVIAWGTTLCANANTPVTISSVSSVAVSVYSRPQSWSSWDAVADALHQSPTGGAASPATSAAATSANGGAGTTTVTATTSSSETVVTVTASSSTEPGSSTPVSTSTFTSVFTSGTVTSTVTGESTIFGVGGVAGATSLPVTTITSPIVSTETTGTTTYETTVGTTTFESSITGSALTSALSSQASAATRTSSAQVCLKLLESYMSCG